MVTIEQLAEAALNGESLLLRSLTQDLLRENPILSKYPKLRTNDSRILAAAASLVELLTLRLHQTPPLWTKDVGALPEPICLLKAAASMKLLRALCERKPSGNMLVVPGRTGSIVSVITRTCSVNMLGTTPTQVTRLTLSDKRSRMRGTYLICMVM